MDTITQRPPVFLVDASIYIFRAWFAFPDTLHDSEGMPGNATYGFVLFLLNLLEETHAGHIMLAFDVALAGCFRNILYPAYKANRNPTPPDLLRQFDTCRSITETLGVATVAHASYEADDLIGSTANMVRSHGMRAVVVSADKDFGQLLQPGDEQWDYARGRRWGPEGVLERLGVRCDQVIDFLALAGDAADNIPGVPGIGTKTSVALLQHFDSLENLLEHLDQIPSMPIRGAAGIARRLHEHRAIALLSQRLATISLDAPVPQHVDDLRRGPGNAQALQHWCEYQRLGHGIRQRCMTQIGAR